MEFEILKPPAESITPVLELVHKLIPEYKWMYSHVYVQLITAGECKGASG